MNNSLFKLIGAAACAAILITSTLCAADSAPSPGTTQSPKKTSSHSYPFRGTVDSVDSSAKTITLDGKPTDKQTPATFELEVDSVHEVRLAKADYKDMVKAPIRIAANEETIEKLRMLPSVIRVRMLSTPEGASVKVGGVDMGLTPVTIERAPDDPYPQVVFTRSGCDAVTTTVPFDREKAEDRYEVTLKCR